MFFVKVHQSSLVIFRIELTISSGGGHYTRCITLAKSLQLLSFDILFIISSDLSHVQKNTEALGFKCITINPSPVLDDASLTSRILMSYSGRAIALIIDHYDIDFEWISSVRPYCTKVVVIDDLANRKLDCDLLVNQVHNSDISDYRLIVPQDCQLLLGSNYTLLRPEFLANRMILLSKKPPTRVQKIHLLFGAGDPMSLCAIYACNILDTFADVELVINSSQHSSQLELLNSISNASGRVHHIVDSTDIAADMSQCQFAVGTPGMSTWERACLGIPSIQIGSSLNQVEIMRELDRSKICHWFGMAKDVRMDCFLKKLKVLLGDDQWRSEVRQSCLRAVDGKGTKRVSTAIMSLLCS